MYITLHIYPSVYWLFWPPMHSEHKTFMKLLFSFFHLFPGFSQFKKCSCIILYFSALDFICSCENLDSFRCLLLIINVTPMYLFSSHILFCYIHVFICSKHYIGIRKMSWSQKILSDIAHDIHKYVNVFCFTIKKLLGLYMPLAAICS